MAVDEALVVLAEAILLAGLLMFSARLWSARFDPYPQLVAQLLNSSPVDAELFIALPKPVRVELDRLCQAGSCYSIAPLGAVYGTAWDWLIVYKRKTALAGGGVPPSPYAVLAVQVRRVNHAGVDLGPVQGVQVRIMGQTYVTGAGGWVNVTLVKGYTYTVEIVQTGFNNGWGRYSFYRWGDGSTENPRSVYLSDSVQLLAYVWDERLLKVTYTAGGSVSVDGSSISSGWTSWYKLGSSVTLQATPSAGYYFQKWQRGVNSDSVADYSTSNPITTTMDDGYRFHAVFDALKWLTVQVYRVDKAGSSLGGAGGVQVRIDGNSYTADSNGVVKVQVVPGTHTVEIVQTSFNDGWGRYTFWRWWDGSTANPRTFTVTADSTVTAYAWDERLLKITYTSGGAVKVNGTQVSSGYTTWCRYGSVATLEAVPSSGYQFVKWQRGVNSDSLSDYSTSNPITVTLDNGYRFHAVFGTTYTFTVEVRRVDYAGTDIGPAVAAVVVVNGQSYTTDSSGRVTFTNVAPGASFTVQFNQQTFNSGWGRYTFWKWWDGSTSNPRTFTVTGDTTATMYVYDERLLKVSYGSSGVVRVNGTQVSSGWSNWYRFGVRVVLEAVPNSGYALQKWQRGVNTDTLSDYDVRLKETVTASGSSEVVAVVTSNAYTGYIEATMSYTSPGGRMGIWMARIEACPTSACYKFDLLNSTGWMTGSGSGTLTYRGTLQASRYIRFTLTAPMGFTGTASLTGTVLRPATNPLLVTVDNGYHYRAEFGAP
ncbi:MAG: hypothetical protein QXI84_09510 [Thermofilaceae archaeon]